MEKWLIPGLELREYKMSLQYLARPENKEVLKKQKKKKKDRDMSKGYNHARRGSHWSNWGQFQ